MPSSIITHDELKAGARRARPNSQLVPRSDRAITIALAVTGLVAAFIQTLVTPIIPDLPTLLHANGPDATWVLTATLLAAAVATPISGRLGEMVGKRKVVLILLVITIMGSVICALAGSLIPMIIGRALQGVGIGVVALGVSILRDTLQPQNLGRAVAVISATLGVGGAVGLPLAAFIAENLDFHYLFWFAAALSVASLLLIGRIIPSSPNRAGGAFDYRGAFGFAVGLVSILLALTEGTTWGWASPAILSLLGGGVVVLIIWGFVELRTSTPLVDLRIAARRPVLLTNLGSITIGFAFFTVTAALPVLLESPASTGVGLGQTLLQASLFLTPLGLVMFFIAPVTARPTTPRGARTSLALGGSILVVGFVAAAFMHAYLWEVVALTASIGLGVGFAYAAMPTLIMQSVPASATAAANGLNSVMRTFGSTLAATMVGLALTSHSDSPNEVAIPPSVAFSAVFLVSACVAGMGVILFAAIPRTRQAKEYRATQ